MAFRKQAKEEKAAALEAQRRALETERLARQARTAFDAWEASKLQMQRSVVQGDDRAAAVRGPGETRPEGRRIEHVMSTSG